MRYMRICFSLVVADLVKVTFSSMTSFSFAHDLGPWHIVERSLDHVLHLAVVPQSEWIPFLELKLLVASHDGQVAMMDD